MTTQNTHSSSLAHWQENFSLSLLDQLNDELTNTFITQSSNASEQRFAIYQNNVFHSLTTALGDLYPIVKKLVGDDFFTGTASYYLRKHPPHLAAMVHFGQSFPDFLRDFEHTRTISYLANVATLELAHHQAYHAIDKAPLTADIIAAIDPEQLASSHIELHPSLRMVKAEQAIFTIWQNHQKDDNEEIIALNEPQQVLVVRPVYDVCTYNIDMSTYDFIDYLSKGHTFQEAAEVTLTTHQAFDISGALNFALQEQLFSHIINDKN